MANLDIISEKILISALKKEKQPIINTVSVKSSTFATK